MKKDPVILIVDDATDLWIPPAHLVEKHGAKFVLLDDASEAQQKLASGEIVPDAIVVDLFMPMIDGIEFVEWLNVKFPRYLDENRVWICSQLDRGSLSRKTQGTAAGRAQVMNKGFDLDDSYAALLAICESVRVS